MRITRMDPRATNEERLRAAVEDAKGVCSMTGCPVEARSVVVINAEGDGKQFFVVCCEEHFKFLVAEMSKQPDHLYTQFRTGKQFMEEKDQ